MSVPWRASCSSVRAPASRWWWPCCPRCPWRRCEDSSLILVPSAAGWARRSPPGWPPSSCYQWSKWRDEEEVKKKENAWIDHFKMLWKRNLSHDKCNISVLSFIFSVFLWNTGTFFHIRIPRTPLKLVLFHQIINYKLLKGLTGINVLYRKFPLF